MNFGMVVPFKRRSEMLIKWVILVSLGRPPSLCANEAVVHTIRYLGSKI